MSSHSTAPPPAAQLVLWEPVNRVRRARAVTQAAFYRSACFSPHAAHGSLGHRQRLPAGVEPSQPTRLLPGPRLPKRTCWVSRRNQAERGLGCSCGPCQESLPLLGSAGLPGPPFPRSPPQFFPSQGKERGGGSQRCTLLNRASSQASPPKMPPGCFGSVGQPRRACASQTRLHIPARLESCHSAPCRLVPPAA